MKTRFAWWVALGISGGQVVADIQNGDLLINGFGFGGITSIGQYTADGTLIRTYLGSGSSWIGASLTPEGQVVTTRRASVGVNIFDPDGTEVFTFNTPEHISWHGDVNVFSDGVLAVNDLAGYVHLYTQDGNYITTYTVPFMPKNFFGGFVDVNDNLWIADVRNNGQHNGRIHKFARDGTLLDSFELDWEPGDLVVVDDGTVWASDRKNHTAMHLSATGMLIESFPTAVQGFFNTIAVDLDGTIWAGGGDAHEILHYSADGEFLGGFDLLHPGMSPVFMTVARNCFGTVNEEVICHADGTTFTVNIEGLNACTGGTTQVTFTASGGAVGEELCFTALINDGGFCCTTEICVTIPDCSAPVVTIIDFDELADGDVVTNQFPGATFSSSAGNVNLVTTLPNIAHTPPNIICTGPMGGIINCVEDTFVDFTNAVESLTFWAIAVNLSGTVAEVNVFVGDVFDTTVDIVGLGDPFTPFMVDLSSFSNVTRIELVNITDQGGIGWDTFYFSVTAGLPNDCDLNGDGIVGIEDFLFLLSTWGSCSDCGTCPADFDSDCSVGILDLLILLGNWG